MSEEDNLEQVYQDLCRSRSDIDTQYIREKLTEKEMEAKLRARDSIHKALANDIILARHWLSALGNKSAHESRKRKQSENDNTKSPAGESEEHWQEYLVEFLDEPGSWDDPFKHKYGLEIEGSIEQLLQRTARRLESDSYRLLRLLTCLAGRDQELKDTDVEWLVPYLETQLQLLRGDYKRDRDEEKEYMENDLDYLAYRHMREQERLEREDRVLTGQPLVTFNTPHFGESSQPPTKRRRIDEEVLRDSIDSNISPIDPVPHAYVNWDEPQQIEVDDESIAGKIKEESIDCKCGCHKDLGKIEKYDPRYSTKVRELATEIIGGRKETAKDLQKSLAIGKRLLTEKTAIEENSKEATGRLQRELELRKVSEEQILALKCELRREDTLEQTFVNSDPILENVRSERAFQLKRFRLVAQLKEFEGWWHKMRKEEEEHGMNEEESRIHEGHYELMNKFRKDLKDLENERERVWLEFVGGLDGLNQGEIAIWKELRGVRNAGPPRGTNLKPGCGPECLYCVVDGCEGCFGYRGEYEKPWLEV